VWASRALAALSRSRFLAGVGDRLLIGNLKQVRRYFTDETLRSDIGEAVASSITHDTRVVVGHSLGSVVAYEVLCAAPDLNLDLPARSFVTLGSPLGLPNLVFDRLQPEPRPRGAEIRGHWPESVGTWTNIADAGDVVAAVEDLRPLFGAAMHQVRVHNSSHAHDMRPYLTEAMTGAAIVVGLNA
jgi:pimeloyl-ACP methyl ester carboxylesterase